METKYKVGDVVFERIRPTQNLIVSRFFDNVYYCKVVENLKRKELVYFENELKGKN